MKNRRRLFIIGKIMFHSIQFNLPRFLITSLAVGLLLGSFSCGLMPKNACEISAADAEKILGSAKLMAGDKSALPAEEGRNIPNVRGCSYATDEHIQISSLRWTNIEFGSEGEAVENYTRVSAITRENVRKTDIPGIADQSYLTEEDDSGRKISIAARKGKNILMVIAHLTNSSEKSVENLKTLAKKIADKTSN